jgi:hypothetical protein
MMKTMTCLMLTMGLLFAGCGDDGGTEPGADAAPMLPADDCTTGESHFYVLNTLDIAGETMGVANTAPGFNLDGIVSDGSDTEGCNAPDYMSPEGEAGIDNALAGLLPILNMFAGDISGTIASQINDGSLLVLVEVQHVDDFTNDACVGMNLYVGEVPAMGMPTLEGGLIAAGQTFDINPESVDAMGAPLISVEGATITGGRMNASTPIISIPVPLEEGVVLNLNIREARVAGNISANSMSGGLIGGALAVSELASAVEALDIGGVDAATVESVLGGQADMRGTDMECSSVSTALSFTGVDAVKGMVVAGTM